MYTQRAGSFSLRKNNNKDMFSLESQIFSLFQSVLKGDK